MILDKLFSGAQTECRIGYVAREEDIIITRRFYFASGRTDTVSYSDRQTMLHGSTFRFRDFNGKCHTTIQSKHIEQSEVVSEDRVAYKEGRCFTWPLATAVEEARRLREMDHVVSVSIHEA